MITFKKLIVLIKYVGVGPTYDFLCATSLRSLTLSLELTDQYFVVDAVEYNDLHQ